MRIVSFYFFKQDFNLRCIYSANCQPYPAVSTLLRARLKHVLNFMSRIGKQCLVISIAIKSNSNKKLKKKKIKTRTKNLASMNTYCVFNYATFKFTEKNENLLGSN